MFHTDVTHKVMMGGGEGLPAVRQTQTSAISFLNKYKWKIIGLKLKLMLISLY